MDKSLAEFIGTFALVFFGCGAAVIGGMGSGATAIDLLGIATAFGLAIVAMAYGIGPISGCHVNPAVSFGVFVAGAMSLEDMIRYWIAQILGAIVGAAVLYVILSGKAQGWSGSLGQDGWGEGNFGGYNTLSAFVFEVVGTESKVENCELGSCSATFSSLCVLPSVSWRRQRFSHGLPQTFFFFASHYLTFRRRLRR